MLALNSTEAERNRGCNFSQPYTQFDPTDVAKSQGTITGTVPIVRGRGAVFNGAGGNYISYPCGSLFNKTALSIVLEFYPEFLPNDGAATYLLDHTAGSRYLLLKTAAGSGNTLQADWAGVTILNIALATYQGYWQQYKRNVLVITGQSGTNAMYLNGVSIGTSVSAWTPVNPLTFYVGSNNAGGNNFSGRFGMLKTFSAVLSAQEAKDYFDAG